VLEPRIDGVESSTVKPRTREIGGEFRSEVDINCGDVEECISDGATDHMGLGIVPEGGQDGGEKGRVYHCTQVRPSLVRINQTRRETLATSGGLDH
jgi:hypothetical protein